MNVNRRGQAAKLQVIPEAERRKERDAKGKSWAGNSLEKLVRSCPTDAHPDLHAASEGRGKCTKSSNFCFAVRHVQENVQQPPGVEGHQGTPGSPAAPMGTSENPCDMADASAEDQAELVS